MIIPFLTVYTVEIDCISEPVVFLTKKSARKFAEHLYDMFREEDNPPKISFGGNSVEI